MSGGRDLSFGGATFWAPPMTWIEGGVRRGFEPELAAAIAEDLGRVACWVDLEWEDFYSAVDRARVEVLLCNQAIMPEREELVAFTRPYGYFDEAIVVRNGRGLDSARSLEGCRIAAIVGSTNLEIARAIRAAEIVEIEDDGDVFETMIDLLSRGEIDGFVDDELPLASLAASDPKFSIAHVYETQQPYGMAVARADRALLRELNGSLERLIAAGVLSELWGRWFPNKRCPAPLDPRYAR